MITVQVFLWWGGGFAAAYLLTGWVLRHAPGLGMVDEPNHRSSHIHPTPRGGGLGVLLGFFALWSVFLIAGVAPVDLPSAPWALGAALALVAFIGFLDDRGHVPALVRLVVQFVSATLVVWALGSPEVRGLEFVPTQVMGALSVVALVWVINLYNFMDGTDGIAGIEAATVLGAGGVVSALGATDIHAALFVPWLLAAGTLGFLLWNWPPARIFMGDAGSNFLGLAIGALAIDAYHRFAVDPVAWVILGAVFFADATWTLIRRLLRGERIHQAHRSHAYQLIALRLIERFSRRDADVTESRRRAHRAVSLGVLAINLLWLFPLAVVAVRWPEWAWEALVAAYVPLMLVCLRSGAGSAE
ncbi:MAG: MraY family glycosyltransferase [Gammaproteobacteria bacterium]